MDDGARISIGAEKRHALPHRADNAEICQRLVIEKYAPAAVLINRAHECLYFLGPTDRYLRVPPGHPTRDLLAMSRGTMRARLRSAIKQVTRENPAMVAACDLLDDSGEATAFSIDVQLVPGGEEELLLICFVDAPRQPLKQAISSIPGDGARVTELEHELEVASENLKHSARTVALLGEERERINQEASSVNEEIHAANEELISSKEELQALNEELTALNCQLQETLDRQRTTSNDLRNVLYSTDVATIFLDTELRIRFFTPATKSLFSVISSDIGRPLTDLSSLTTDDALLSEARKVLRTGEPLEQEIEARGGNWYVRRILPYRTLDNGVEGIVITFTDITERKHVAKQLEAARERADRSNVAKTGFLATASHDLRQPLQTLALLQGMLATSVKGERARRLIARTDEALGAMSGILNTLLDINQIEAGIVRPTLVNFPVNDVLDRLRDEFTYHALARGLALRVVPCGLCIRSDPRLLEQMIRNLLSNALKYTRHGKVLLGCRRNDGMLSIEVWDTGIGIPAAELDAIFEDYHQVENSAGERSRGPGLGLAVAQRLGKLAGHRISVHSRPGKGSLFAIDVQLSPAGTVAAPEPHRSCAEHPIIEGINSSGAILVIEDDPDVGELLELILKDEGYRTVAASDGFAALELVAQGTISPDLILADYDLPNGMNGVEVTAKLRGELNREIPLIILTGELSTCISQGMALESCVQLSKPVKLKELTRTIRRILPIAPTVATRFFHASAETADSADARTIFVVDDDSRVRDTIRSALEEAGHIVEDYATCEAFLEAWRPVRAGCLVIDAYLPGMNGLELLQRLSDTGHRMPSIMITGYGDVSIAVRAMKAGASDFLEKPIRRAELLASIERVRDQTWDSDKLFSMRQNAARQIAALTARQRLIMDMVLAGHPNKNIAADLGVSQRTVESHRATIMKKTKSKSLPALARLALFAAPERSDETGIQEKPDQSRAEDVRQCRH